jgi:hypothetical protein
MTKVEAVKKVLKEYGGQATWPQIYEGITEHYPEAKKSKFWQEGIRGVVYREIRAGATFEFADKGRGIIKLHSSIPLYKKINTKTGEITPIANVEELRTEIWAAIGRLAPELADDMGTMNEVSEAEMTINGGDEWQMGDVDGNLDDYKFVADN